MTPEREINLWPVGDESTDIEKLVWRAASLSQDDTSMREPSNRVTWLTAGAEKIAAIVPVEAAERWLENPQEQTEAELAYNRIVRGESTPTEEQKRVTDDIIARYREHPNLLPRELVVTYNRSMDRPEYRTKSGRLISEAELLALSAEAEQGYDLDKAQVRKTVNHPAVITRLARVIAALMKKGILSEAELGMPFPVAMDFNRAEADIEGWLKS